ncbi:UbiA prenyltransferase family-domain-containing protein [Mycena sanguinolenta]|nr:UbiA prenyltransferase family-domain-containing protein [Mycena sanguinolenta]
MSSLTSLFQRAKTLRYQLETLYLFFATDIITTIMPVVIFAVSCAPVCPQQRLSRTIQCIFWMWLQILHCNLANQTSATSLKEDLTNKPFRPIPSGRVTLAQVIVWRYICLACGLLLSALYGRRVVLANIALTIVIVMYNDGRAAAHWFSRNLVNAVAFGVLETGATLVAACDHHRFGEAAHLSLIFSFGIIVTTIHTQDFQDRVGDKMTGRRTLPIVLPVLSRYTIFVGVIAWSVVLSRVWRLDLLAQIPLTLLGTIVGFRCSMLRTVQSDKLTYVLYNVSSSFLELCGECCSSDFPVLATAGVFASTIFPDCLGYPGGVAAFIAVWQW